MDNFSVRFKSLAASVSTNIVDYFKLVFAETETYSVPKHNLCVPKRKNFCAPLKAFNCAFKGYFLAPFKKMAPPPWKTGWIHPWKLNKQRVEQDPVQGLLRVLCATRKLYLSNRERGWKH